MKRQWSNTYEEETLTQFQRTCDEYGIPANSVVECLMRFFSSSDCYRLINKRGSGLTLEIVKTDMEQ